MILSRFRLISASLILFFFLVPTAANSANITGGKSIEKRLQDIQNLPDNKIDLFETLLLISKHWNPNLPIQPLRPEISSLVSDVKRDLPGDANKIVRSLRNAIHTKAGFRYTDQVDARGIPINDEELFLHGMLNTKRGYCMNLSLLYLILGQKLNLPLFGVPLPNHFFVRYENGGNQINIEATEMGTSFPDSFYSQRYLPPSENKSSYFLNNLNTKQTLGAYFSNIGMVYYQNKKIERAVFYLRSYTNINPTSIDAQNNLANIYSEQNNYSEAINHYNLALKASPGNFSTLFNLGLAYQKIGNIDEAIKSFLQVVQLDTSSVIVHQILANLFLKKNRIISSLLHLKALAKLQPESLQNKINISKAFSRLGQHSVAIQTLESLKGQFPGDERIHAALAEAYYRSNDFAHATEQYRLLIDRNPNDLKNYIQLGWTHYKNNELDMAAAWTLRGLNKSKGNGNLTTLAMMNLGFYSLLQKKYNDAKKWYGKVLAGSPPEIAESLIADIQSSPDSKRADLKFFSGWIYSETKQIEKAKWFLQSYLAMKKNGEFSEEARSLLKTYEIKDTLYFQKTSNSPGSSTVPPEMTLVPSGFFKMGLKTGLDDERPEHRVFLDSFFMDKYEVSAKDFSEFLNIKNNVKGYYLDNKFGTLFYDGKFHPRPGLENYPVNNVTWKAASDYCNWKGKRLPSEAEWEKAARGGNGNPYPWGKQLPSPNLARYHQTWSNETKHQVMVPVNALEGGKSPYGIYNMAGNVKEWVDDWYDREYYKEIDEYANPKGPIGGEFKVVRGGSWRDLKGFIYSSFRNNGNPESRMDDYGFRCAQSVSPNSEPKKLTRLQVPEFSG
ncbi:MAG: SUMF1/EgtB/PvdO family nonheme iron enzyme [Nitrospinae bacterium]|nr:SUMF1/EgtB/PvdO family nonheme iron enzyme [Nitrospinota bacterium]